MIGPVRVPNRVVLAPMTGVTDLPVRRLVSRLGAGLVVSEMTASQALAGGGRAAKLRVEGRGVGIHVVQLAGCEARWMAEGARVAEASGADIIDINMGCPAKKVVNGYAGSALMRDLDHAVSLIDAVVGAVSVPVTLKMRLGWDNHSRNAPELARRAEQAGIKLITVHGRTRCQFYDGKADWRAIRAVKDAVTIPVIANGDLTTFADVAAMLAQSGADAIMIGRGANGRPWLPGQLAKHGAGGIEVPPSLPEQHALIAELYDDELTHYGAAIGLRHARKHLGWALNVAAATVRVAPDHLKAHRDRVLTATEPAAVRRELKIAYDAFAGREAA